VTYGLIAQIGVAGKSISGCLIHFGCMRDWGPHIIEMPPRAPNKKKNNNKNQNSNKKNGSGNGSKKMKLKPARGNALRPNLVDHHYLDPHRAQHFARPAHGSTPYTVLRERITTRIQTSTTQETVMVISPFYAQSSVLQGPGGQTNIVAFYGQGPTAPFASTAVVSSLLTSGLLGSRIRLHRMAVSVSCIGTTSTTATPDGLVQLGTLRTPINLAGFATLAAVGTFVDTREEVLSVSSQSIQFQPKRVVSFPLDKVSYDNFTIFAPNPSSTDVYSGDDMAPIVLRFPSTVNINNIVVTLSIEWACMFDNNAILQSTAKLHPVLPDDAWHRMSAAAMQVGGAVSNFIGNGISNAAENLAQQGVAAIGGLAYRGLQGIARQPVLMLTR